MSICNGCLRSCLNTSLFKQIFSNNQEENQKDHKKMDNVSCDHCYCPPHLGWLSLKEYLDRSFEMPFKISHTFGQRFKWLGNNYQSLNKKWVIVQWWFLEEHSLLPEWVQFSPTVVWWRQATVVCLLFLLIYSPIYVCVDVHTCSTAIRSSKRFEIQQKVLPCTFFFALHA